MVFDIYLSWDKNVTSNVWVRIYFSQADTWQPDNQLIADIGDGHKHTTHDVRLFIPVHMGDAKLDT